MMLRNIILRKKSDEKLRKIRWRVVMSGKMMRRIEDDVLEHNVKGEEDDDLGRRG